MFTLSWVNKKYWRTWGEKHLNVDDYMLDKLLDKTKELISIERVDDTKILIDTDDKLSDDITIKNFVIWITCVIKDDRKLYPQIILVEELLVA